MSLKYRSPAKLAAFLVLVVAAACGSDDGGNNQDTDSGQQDTDQDQVDDNGPADDDNGGADIDNGDGDATPTDNEPPPVFGLEERPAQDECIAFTAPPVTGEARFIDRFPGIRFSGPVSMTQRPGDNSRIYVNERDGVIWSFPNDPTATNADKVKALDLSAVEWANVDCSTASLVFPADFATYGAAYVNYCYTYPGNHIQVRLSRFYSSNGGLTFDPASEQVLVAINYLEAADDAGGHSFGDGGLHAGDAAHFGVDGYLYWSVGDGGPQGRVGGMEAQHLSQLRGKMLRLDVSDLTKEISATELASFVAGMQYTAVDIPPSNPFFGADPNPTGGIVESAGIVQPLIYASGFRNPWQWSFDPADNSIWLGDVGNYTYEEVNRGIVAGGNYGWGFVEGFHCAPGNGWSCPADVPVNVKWPIYQILHGAQYDVDATPESVRIADTDYGNAVTGGVVYRGTAVPAYTGSYFFGDFSQARIWTIRDVDGIARNEGNACTVHADCGAGMICMSFGFPYDGAYPAGVVGAPTAEPHCTVDHELLQTGVPVSSFSRDQNNEVYAVMLYGAPGDGGGYIGMLQATPATGGTGGPPALLSQTGCFEVTTSGSTVVGEPVDDLIPFAPSAQLWSDGATKRRWMSIPDAATITVDAAGDFQFPIGTVLVKEFSLDGHKVETRFLTRQVADGHWAAYSYEWNDEGTDAELVDELGATKTWPVGAGTQQWKYPGRSQCFACHNAVDKTALGPETAQLNHAIVYPASGETANQMLTLAHIGVVDTTSDPAPWSNLAAIEDASRSVEERARAYLHANCSICHRPGGPTFTPADMRYSTAFADMNVCNQPPTISDMDGVIVGANTLFTPGDPEHSQIYRRPGTTTSFRMPPLATSIPHDEALAVIAEWISAITACE